MNHLPWLLASKRTAVGLILGLLAFTVQLTSHDVFAQKGIGGRPFESKIEPFKPPEKVGSPERLKKHEASSPAVERLNDPIRLKSNSQMTGSAPLRRIGRPIASVGIRPPSARPLGPKFITILPKSVDAYRNTFGKDPSKEASLELESLADQFTQLNKSSQNLGSSRDGYRELRESFRKAAEAGHDSVIVVGHSIGGPNGSRELKLPDGSKLKLQELYEWAASEHLECRIATCHGKDFGIDAPVSLGRVLRLVADLAQPTVAVPSDAPVVTSNASTNSKAVSNWDIWDNNFSFQRDELGYNNVILVGATRGVDGYLHVWESVRARPFWIALMSWLVLIAGIVGNASVMWWMHRQDIVTFGSLHEMERETAERFRQSSKLALATAIASILTLAVALIATEMGRQERAYNAATGWMSQRSSVDLPALGGVGLMALSALAGRVDPSRAWVARLIHSLSGAVAGTLAAFLVVMMIVGSIGLVFIVLWGNILNALVCWFNGYDKLSGMAIASLRWWAVLSAGISSLFAFHGTYQGLLAGYCDLPVFLAVRVGVENLKTGRPLCDPPEALMTFVSNVWCFMSEKGPLALMLALLWMWIGLPVHFLAMIVGFVLYPNSPVEETSVGWSAVISAGIIAVAAVAFLVGHLVAQRHQKQQGHKASFKESMDSTSVHSSTTTSPVQSDKANSEATNAGTAIQSGRCFSVTPDGVATLVPDSEIKSSVWSEKADAKEMNSVAPIQGGRCFSVTPDGVATLNPDAATDETPHELQPGLGREGLSWFESFVGVVVALIIVVVPSAIYVYARIDDPAYTAGTLVEFVGVDSSDPTVPLNLVTQFKYPPTVPVYQVPVVLTQELHEMWFDREGADGVLSHIDIGRHRSSLFAATQTQGSGRIPDQLERRRLLRGPSGVVFRLGVEEEGIVDGLVVKGSRGEVIADDQGGFGDRAVLIRLLPDPGLGEDRRVVVVARASDVRPMFPKADSSQSVLP